LPAFADEGVAGDVALEPALGEVAGRGWLLSHAASKARDNAATAIVVFFIQASKVKVEATLQRRGLT
jgi:hypothetical protein